MLYKLSVHVRNTREAGYRVCKIMRFYLCLLSILLVPFSLSAETIKFGLPVEKSSLAYLVLNDIYQEAFLRVGVNYESIPCVPKSCGSLVRLGVIQGEAVRQEQYVGTYSNIEILNFKLIRLNSVIITRADQEAVSSLNNLADRNYTVGYQAGYFLHEAMLGALLSAKYIKPEVVLANGIEHVLDGSIDAFLAIEPLALTQLSVSDRNQLVISRLKHEVDYFLYPVIIKNFKYKQQLLNSLQQLRNKGVIDHIYQKHDFPLDDLTPAPAL